MKYSYRIVWSETKDCWQVTCEAGDDSPVAGTRKIIRLLEEC